MSFYSTFSQKLGGSTIFNPQLAKFKSDLVSIGKMVVNNGYMSIGLVEHGMYLQWLFMVMCKCKRGMFMLVVMSKHVCYNNALVWRSMLAYPSYQSIMSC